MSCISERTIGRLALLILLAGSAACERIVSVSAPAATPRLVVEARLEKPRGTFAAPQRIRLTTTDDVFSSRAAPPVRDARVRVLDAAGTVTPFLASDTEPGVYLAPSMRLGVGQQLTLEILWEGDRYAATETVLAAVPLDTLYFSPAERGLQATGLRATVSTTDPEQVKNFYLWDQWVDGVRLVSPDSESFSRAVLSDDLFDGSAVRSFQPYWGIAVRPGQLVRVRQLSIPEQAFRFFETLSDQTDNNGSPFGVAPGSVRGNVANTTRPSRLALGYFIAAQYTELERRVP